MTTSAAPCTTLSVMTTMSDLTDDFRLHAFAAGLSLLHHRFDRAQVFVDFANKSADAPAATLSKAEALSHSLVAILRRARVLRGESSVSVLRYGADASKYEALLARAFGVDAAEAARLASHAGAAVNAIACREFGASASSLPGVRASRATTNCS